VEPGLADARTAGDEHRWGDAWRLYSQAPGDLDVDDLGRFATAAYLIGRDEESFDLWGRAHRAAIEAGTVHRAAHFGVRLSQALLFKGDLPRSRGWVDRVARLLDDAGIDCVEQGHLEHALGMATLFETGDLAAALAAFDRAGKVAARFADRELATVARMSAGRIHIYLGDVLEGLAMLDAAVVSIESGDLSPFATGDAWCTVIDACEELSDVVRCRAWTTSMRRWCDTQQELVLYRGHCFIHGASALRVLGRWREGLEEARRAAERLAGPLPAVLGAAACLEADLLRLLGDRAAAEAAYHRASELGHDPQPGLALLRLGQGEVESAVAMVRRTLAEAEGPVARARVLGPAVEVLLAAGAAAAARAAGEELRAIARELASPMLGAVAARAAGAVALASGEPTVALQELRRAFLAFRDLDAHHDGATTRLLIAVACEALGDHDTAAMEEAAGRRALESFCVEPDRSDPTGSATEGLTRRELDVLRLLASGRTNRAIGEQLFISEKTVATHVSHIFTKLGVGSRAAATAHAYDHGLL
jgi:DNA-binding CsgD family transcriptional regulator